ncbi:hypothetical protein [Pyruvatibacter sp.]
MEFTINGNPAAFVGDLQEAPTDFEAKLITSDHVAEVSAVRNEDGEYRVAFELNPGSFKSGAYDLDGWQSVGASDCLEIARFFETLADEIKKRGEA